MAKTKEPAPKAKPAAVPAPLPAPSPAYTVVARRYRPQQFADLIGQEHIAQALSNAITSGRIAHAYLFTGARGVGKTSTARILAKALNCEKGPTASPCDRCDICKSVAGGDDVDVIEIDGASNNKVDEVRDLRSNVGFRPTRGRFKIYIIDEVHMLSNSAFNALLKTLEEPPPHVKFILATTEVQKIPITILSRCQRYDFATLGPAQILNTLKHIAQKEGIAADEDALRIVARRANGSMRDSQTLLEQLLGACDGVLTAEKVHALFGTASEERVAELADAILGGDARRGVELVGTSVEQGLQLGELLDQLVDFWRGLMLIAVGGSELESLPDSTPLRELMAKHAAADRLDPILAGIDILTATKAKLRGSPHTQVLFEVAVIRLARLGDMLSVSQLVQSLTGVPMPPVSGKPSLPVRGTAAPDSRNLDPGVKKKRENPPELAAANPKSREELSEATFSTAWERVLEHVGPMLAAHLRQASDFQANFKPNSLVIQYDTAYSSTYETVRGDRAVDTVRRALKVVTGDEWLIRVGLKPPTGETVQSAPAVTGTPPPVTAPRQRNALLGLPMFRVAHEVLGAQLVRVDDGFDPKLATAVADTPDDATRTLTDPDEA